MRDSFKEIRTAYYSALNGNISITDANGNSVNVPIYDNIPDNATYPFIHFDSFDIADRSVKDQYLQDVRMFLTVYTKYESSYGGSTDSDNITDGLMQLLMTDVNQYITTTNFRVITTKLESRNNDKVVTSNYKMYLSTIVISHTIEQTTDSVGYTCPPINVTFDNYLIDSTNTDLNIDCSTYLNMAILSDNVSLNGNWIEDGTNLGKPLFRYELDSNGELFYNGTNWQVELPPFIDINATAGNEAYPWLATWSGVTVVEGTIENYCGGGVCADATVENSDATYSNTVASGGSLVLPDITITKPDATTVSYPSVKNIMLSDYQSGIAYQRPPLTGQTTSYRTGDDAWRVANMPYTAAPANPTHVAKLVDIVTLSSNNAFGNTYRFTDQAGNKAINYPMASSADLLTNDTLIDHYTGLEWGVKDSQTGNNKDWNTAIDECLALNVQGFDDWYLPNAEEWFSVTDFNGNGIGINIIFGLGVRAHWSSTTDFADTTYAVILNVTSSTVTMVNRNTKVTNRNYYPVRQRY